MPLAVAKELGLPEDIVNVGGAIAHGHPIGATGAVHCHRLSSIPWARRTDARTVTLCIGGGGGSPWRSSGQRADSTVEVVTEIDRGEVDDVQGAARR